MPITPDDLETRLVEGFARTSEHLHLRYDEGMSGARSIRGQAITAAAKGPHRSRRWVIGASAALALAGGAGAAAASLSSGNDARQQFSVLNPAKNEHGPSGYAKVGHIGHGALQSVLYVSTTGGPRSCGLVQVYDHAIEQSSFGFCADEPTGRAQLRRIDGVIVASVPPSRATSITVTGPDEPAVTAALVHSHAILDPANLGTGALTVTAHDRSGALIGQWLATPHA